MQTIEALARQLRDSMEDAQSPSAGEHSASWQMNRDPASLSPARELARKALASWDLERHSNLAELIVSELATNAICHGEGRIWIRLRHIRGSLLVEVGDEGTGLPVRRHATRDDDSGRGLALLDGLIELHGGSRGTADNETGNGKTVYVVIQLN